MAIRDSVLRHVGPEISSAGLVYVGDSLLDRILVSHRALEVVATLAATIRDLPRALGVVAGDGGSRPDVSVARNLAAVVEVVEQPELPRQLMLVRRDVLTIHRQRRIAVAHAYVTKELIVGAILLDDVNHMVNQDSYQPLNGMAFARPLIRLLSSTSS